MTQEQYQWLKDNGYDPAVYDVDDQGNIFESPVSAPATQKKMSPLRAAGTSFLGNLLPSAAGLYAGAQAGGLGGSMFGPIGTIVGGIGGGLAGGYGAGKLQEKALEEFAPEAVAEMQRAQTDQPLASYAGGFLPNALAFRPSLQGMSGLLRPTVRGEETLRAALSNPNFLAPAANIAANVGASGAGQLLNVAEGGEFSAPRFAADVALGTLFNRPTALGRAVGFHDLPQTRPVESPELAPAREQAEFMAYPPREFVTPRAERGFEDIKTPGVNIGLEAPERFFTPEGKPVSEKSMAKDYTNWWKSETEPTTELLKGAAEEVKSQIPKERLKELSQDPEVGEVLRDPSKMEAFIAKQADQTLEDVYQMMERREAKQFATAEEAASQKAFRELQAQQGVPKETALSDVEAAYAARQRTPTGETRELYSPELEGPSGRVPSGSKTAEGYQFIRPTEPTRSAVEAGREVYGAELEGPSGRPPSLSQVAKGDKTAYEAYSGQRPPEVVKNATDAAREVYTRLQRAEGAGDNRITQQDIDFAAEMAARRGLKIELDRAFAGDQEVRGMYFVDPKTGERIIRVNPLMATADTAIHEIGHDIFTGVTNKGMRRSLMDTAMDSPAYKAELAAREAEVKAGRMTPEAARDIALEEGLIQAFGEKMPGINRGELRSWFKAFKASIKQLATGKLSPEDALAWMHYASTEAVPWKGVAVGKTGEERFSRAKEASRRLMADDIDWDSINKLNRTRELNLEDLISGVMPELKMYQEKPNVFREDVVISREPSLLSGEGSWGRAYTTGARNEGHVMIDSALWDAAVANEPGMRDRFVNVLKHELGHIDDAPNIGEHGAARDERVADEFAARYQRAQQETPEFKNWFGESQVVDEQGKPLVVYHGSRSFEDFNTFRTETGHNYGPGAYFTPEPIRASGYAGEAEGARVYSVYVSLKKPYRVTSDATIQDIGYKIRKDPANVELLNKLMDKYDARNSDILGNGEIGNAWLREQGYDGIIKERNRYTEDGFVPEIVEVVAFNPEQVKSATANKGTFSPESKDIRYQRGLGSEIKTPAELDYLTSKGGPFAEVARGVRDAYNTRDYKQGQWSSKYSLTTKLPEEARVRLLNHLAGEFDSGVLKAPASDIKAAYDQLRKDYLPAIVNDYNSKGFMVRDTAGLRARGSNPTYFPLHAVADEVKTILTTKQGSPEYTKLENDFKQWNTQLKQADGATLAEAKRYADEKFADMQNIVAKPPGIESGVSFAGARKPEGYPLPPSWRSDDIIDILNNYTRRSATDYAYQAHVESSPVAMAALGAKTMLNNQPIPANVLASTSNVVTDPSVQSVLREYRGTPAQKTEGLLQSAGRLTSAATIGTVSKVGDIGTSMFKGLAYLPGSEYAAGLSQFVNKIADWAALKERSYASGLNKRDAAENMRQVFGIAEDSTAFMDKAARVMSKVTFVNDLESVARVIAQGWGETVVGINKKLALGGDKNALQMLDTLSPDWRTRSDADLAAQVGRLLQGSYDMRQLPASVLEGAAAPYLTWSKWSIGQYDSFVKYAIQPAMQGNMKPLMGQMLIGLLGGGAVSAVQAWLNNREGKDITWKELEAWMQQNQGELGSDGGQLLAQKLLTMAQKMGTFGFAGDLVKMTLDAAAGGSSQGVATMPAVDAIYDVSKRTAAAIQALDDGEDFGLVMKALMKDSLVGHVQALRVARNWLDEDENLRYDDRRRQRLYDALSGLPSKGGAFSVNYSNLSEREFERGELGEGTGEEAMSLVRKAREQATTPEDYASRIRKLKTSQNQIMPSMERQPMKAARYLSWLEGTEEGKGGETMRRYMIRKQEDEYRKSLVEGLSGLR